MPPVRGHGRDGAGPQVGETAFHRVGRCFGDHAVGRHERSQPVQVLLGAGQIASALVEFEEVVVEVEYPDVPVGDQIEFRAGCVRVGVRTEQCVVVGVEVLLVPDRGAVLWRVHHVHLVSPGLAVFARRLQVRVQPCGIGHVELRQLEGLHDPHPTFPQAWSRAVKANGSRRRGCSMRETSVMVPGGSVELSDHDG